jgi:muconolactone delta-isomerase
MKKFQATISFTMDDRFMGLIPSHRAYVNDLIEKGIIDHYLVSMESYRLWITLMAQDKQEVRQRLRKSPIYPYWTNIEIDELFVVDGQLYRLPALQLN